MVGALAPRQLRLERGKLIEQGREVAIISPRFQEQRA
jgi:hypothetical protein